MRTDALQALRAYWEELRAGRVAPFRSELDPRRFEPVLEHMFILEQLAPRQIRIRLAGLAICEMMGMEVRGMPPEALIAAPDRDIFLRHLGTVLGGPAVAEFDLAAADRHGRQIEAQMLLLPLQSDMGEISRILGCVVSAAGQTRVPVNFALQGQRLRRVNATHPDAALSPVLPGFAEAAPGFEGPPALDVIDNPTPRASAPRTGHLKVVRGR